MNYLPNIKCHELSLAYSNQYLTVGYGSPLVFKEIEINIHDISTLDIQIFIGYVHRMQTRLNVKDSS